MFKINIRVIAALLMIVAVIYFALDAIRTQSYSGSDVSFTTSGIATVTNSTDDPVTLRATSRSSFTMFSQQLAPTTMRGVREGTGRNAVYVATTELPTGESQVRVTRGSGVTFELNGSGSIQANVAARDAEGNRNILIVAGVVCLGLLAYISFTTNHAWLGMARQRFAPGSTDAGAMSRTSVS